MKLPFEIYMDAHKDSVPLQLVYTVDATTSALAQEIALGAAKFEGHTGLSVVRVHQPGALNS
jgi:hypothetical protein